MSTRERLDELVADRAIWGLDAPQQSELDRAMSELGVAEIDPSWETTAVTIQIAYVDFAAKAPQYLVRKLEADALGCYVEQSNLTLSDVASVLTERPSREVAPVRTADETPSVVAPRGRAVRSSWLLAAAAILLAALVGWDRWFAPSAMPAELRAELLAADASIVRIDWSPGPSELRGDPSGDVIWSHSRQQGFMRCNGLPTNDPRERQYQLWIFDRTRDTAQPVDGGVFDIPAGSGEKIVPIDAKILVREGFAFAVTVEAPGGVVVSDREHIVLAAGL